VEFDFSPVNHSWKQAVNSFSQTGEMEWASGLEERWKLAIYTTLHK
jgi:hypothetical protein